MIVEKGRREDGDMRDTIWTRGLRIPLIRIVPTGFDSGFKRARTTQRCHENGFRNQLLEKCNTGYGFQGWHSLH